MIERDESFSGILFLLAVWSEIIRNGTTYLQILLTKNEVEQYAVTSGQLMPLDDLIDEYAPNLTALFEKYPNMKQSCLASDGHIYAIPAIDTSATGQMNFKQWINTAWLDKLGLEVPTTIDEFKDVLIAIRDGDPNGNGESDEIPLGIREPSSVYALGGSFGLEHQFGDTYNVTEGKVHNWLLDDNFKEYLEYLNDLYQELYEAASIDGASRFQKIIHISLPGILDTILILFIMRIGSLMSVGFEKVYLMQNSVNLSSSEIISTFIYKNGIQKGQFSYSTAVGLFNSVINFILLISANFVSKKTADTGLW